MNPNEPDTDPVDQLMASIYRLPPPRVDIFIYTEDDTPDMCRYLKDLQDHLHSKRIYTQIVVYDDPKTAQFKNVCNMANTWVTRSKPDPFYLTTQGKELHLAIKLTERPRLTVEAFTKLIERARLYKAEKVLGLPSGATFKIVKGLN